MSLHANRCRSIVIVFLFCSQLSSAQYTPEQAKDIVTLRSHIVLKLLKTRSLDSLAAFIHPEKGVRFAPYGFISTQTNVLLTRSEIKKAFKEKRIHFWGRYDATGKKRRLTFADYYKRFIYDRPFDATKNITFNEIQRTNFVQNIFDVYPDCIFADYLFLGSADFAEMDWKSLRLIFEEFEGQWYLVHIVHDEWTT